MVSKHRFKKNILPEARAHIAKSRRIFKQTFKYWGYAGGWTREVASIYDLYYELADFIDLLYANDPDLDWFHTNKINILFYNQCYFYSDLLWMQEIEGDRSDWNDSLQEEWDCERQ